MASTVVRSGPRSLQKLLREPARRACRATTSTAGRALSTAPAGDKRRARAYLHMPSDVPLESTTQGQLLERAWSKYADREALVSVYQKHRLTYDQLREKADRLAAGLLSMGLTRGDRVAMWGPNSSEWVIARFAVARAGLTLVTLNPAYQSSEVRLCLRNVGVKAVICDHTFKSQNYHRLLVDAAPEIASSKPGQINSEALPDLKTLLVISDQSLPGAFRFEDGLAAGTSEGIARVRQQLDDIDADAVCEIQFTSGTTGQPKAAMLSNHNMVNNARLNNTIVCPDGKHIIMCTLVPFFHVYSSVVCILGSVAGGHTLVNPSPSYTAACAYQAIKQEKCTNLFGAPTMFVDLLEELRRHDGKGMESVRLMVTGAAMATVEMIKDLKKAMPEGKVRQGYGMTETSPVSFSMPLDCEEEKVYKYVGRLMPHLEAKIIDSKGDTVRFGEPGELCVRGYSTCRGYWNEPKKTEELIGADRWLRTGDQFILEEDGYATIVGRIKDLVIRGGENIAPKEVEDAVATHSNVLESVAFGVYDDRLGEELAVAIRLRDPKETLSVEELKAFLKGKIAHFKIPRYVELVEEWPKTQSGKVQKFKLRERLEKKLGLTKK